MNDRTTINGLTYFWREDGDGPVLLLLHGGEAHSGWYQWMMPRLARSYRVIAPDLRGHGRTDHAASYRWLDYAEDIEALLEKLAPADPYFVAGQCSGGYLGMVLAVRGIRPPRAIAGMEILPALSPEEEAAQFATARRPAHRFATLERAVQAYARVLRLPDGRAELLAREVFGQDAEGYWSSPTDLRTLEIERFASYELAAQVECPTLLMRGTESKSLDRLSFLLMAQKLRHGEFVEIPGVGHQMMVEDPEATTDALEPFLQRAATPPSPAPAAPA